MSGARGRSRRRGAALVAVVIVGFSLILLTLALLALVRSEVASLDHSSRDVQVRLAAVSAVDVVMETLGEQRLDVAAGRVAILDERYELFELAGGRLAVVRILDVSGGGRAMPEASRIDLNRCDVDPLEASGLFEATLASRILRARGARPGGRFAHLSDLLADDPGVEPSTLYGPLEEVAILSRVDGVQSSIGERIDQRLSLDLGSGRARPVDHLTVHSFEPDVRLDGRPRHVPGDPLEEDEDPAIARILGAMSVDSTGERTTDGGAGENAEMRDAATEPSETPDSIAESGVEEGIDARLRRAGFPLETLLSDTELDAGRVVDAIGRDRSRWNVGLLDINTASREALRTLPEIDDAAANEIVARRDALAEERRFAKTWPFELGILDPQRHGSVLDRITTRSFLWRVVLAVGTEDVDAEMEGLENPLVWEILVDIGSEPPRLVELRDVTMFEFVARMIDERETFAGPDVVDVEGEDDTNATTALEPNGGDGLFQGPALFSGQPLFDEQPLFSNAPLFDDEPLFDPDSPDSEGPFMDDPERGDSTDPRSGRWRPATGSR